MEQLAMQSTPTTMMETLAWEPSQQLDVYMRSLGNVDEALEDFRRLADSLAWAAQAPAELPAARSPSYSPFVVAFQSPSSPGGQSSASSVNCCASCTSQWQPAGHGGGSSQWSGTFTQSCASTTSLSCSSGLSCASASASICSGSDFSSAFSSTTAVSNGSGSGSGSGATSSGSKRQRQPSRWAQSSRRKKNATAAEKYRRKVEGRRCRLAEELEREETRNSKLRRTLEAKLALYREFADLLAQNTCDERDRHLAYLGGRSVANILANICPPHECLAEPSERDQLERLLAHFERVQRRAQSAVWQRASSH